MQFDLTALDTSIYVFAGTLMFALVLALFIVAAALTTTVLLGSAGLVWYLIKTVLGSLIHGINFAWDRLVHHAAQVEIPGELQPRISSGTDSYPRVALRDS